MLNYKILNTTKDKFINTPINLDFELMDKSEIIEEFIREEKRKSLNIPQDFEITRFSPIDSNIPFHPMLRVWFYNINDTGVFPDLRYTMDYKGNGFNTDGSGNDDRLKKGFSNSFYLLDFYDSVKSIEQNKLFSVIVPTIPSTPVNKKTIISDILINKDTEGYYLYYLKEKGLLPKDIFMKLTFFNGKTGQMTSFFNLVKTAIQNFGNIQEVEDSLPKPEEYDEEMLYFQYKLNNNYSYDIINVTSGIVNSKLIKQIQAVEVKFKN